MTSPWRSQGPSSSSVLSPPIPFFTSVAGETLTLPYKPLCATHAISVLHCCVTCFFRAVLEGLWLRFHGEQVELCVRRERRRRVLQTLVWFTITLVLALFIPDIGRVISLIGGLAACFIFVFPGTTSVSDSVCVCLQCVYISNKHNACI